MAPNFQPRLLWQPREPSKTMLSKLRCFVNERHGLDLKDYKQLWHYSTAVETANDFWVDAFIFLGLKGDVIPNTALAPRVSPLLPALLNPELTMSGQREACASAYLVSRGQPEFLRDIVVGSRSAKGRAPHLHRRRQRPPRCNLGDACHASNEDGGRDEILRGGSRRQSGWRALKST